MSLEQVKFVSIPVTDQDRAKDFYVNKLGFLTCSPSVLTG